MLENTGACTYAQEGENHHPGEPDGFGLGKGVFEPIMGGLVMRRRRIVGIEEYVGINKRIIGRRALQSAR